MSIIYPERHWDYVVKQTYGGIWKARNQYGLTLATAAANTSLETLVNACLTDKGATPGLVFLAPNGTTMNIDDPIQVPDHTTLQGGGQNGVCKLYLENNSDCNMIEPAAADNIEDVIICDMGLDANKNSNAGNIDTLNWELGACASTEWAMLELRNLKLWNGNRNCLRIVTASGDYATVRMENIKAFYHGDTTTGAAVYLDRVFDTHIHRLSCTNLYMRKGDASVHLEDIYISGGDVDFGIRMDDIGTGSWGPHKNIMTNVRIDNIRPGVAGMGVNTAFEIADVYWLTMSAVEVTNINSGAASDTYNAVEINDGTKGLTWVGGGVIRDPNYSGAVYWDCGIKEQNTATGNTFIGLHFGDSVSSNADDAEIELRAAGGSTTIGCTREGGQIARTRYV